MTLPIETEVEVKTIQEIEFDEFLELRRRVHACYGDLLSDDDFTA